MGMGGPENGNFPLFYVVKMSLHRWVVQKSLKTPLRNIKMAPNICHAFFNANADQFRPKKL